MDNQIQCGNGEGCFEPQQRCDDVKDCEDGFDEDECGKFSFYFLKLFIK